MNICTILFFILLSQNFNKDIGPSIFGFLVSGLSLITFLLFVRVRVTNRPLTRNIIGIITFLCFLAIVFLILSLIFGCINISNFNELKDKDPNDNNLARKMNIAILIIGFMFMACNIFIIIIYVACLRNKLENSFYNSNKQNKSVSNITNNAMTTPNYNNNSEILKNVNPEKNSVQNINNN